MSTEWVILLLLAPAIVAPAVLLLGFTGCGFSHGVGGPPDEPKSVTAVGLSASTIRLAWTYTFYQTPAFTFEIERYTAGETEPYTIAITDERTTWDDSDGLEAGTAYFYRVRAIRTSDAESSDLSPAALGYTFGEAFCAVPGSPCGQIPTPQSGIEGFCIVQRIEPVRLLRSGARILLTLRGGAGPLRLDQISISRPATTGNPYDSGGDLTLVASPVVLPPDTPVTLPAFAYALDRTRPLLIAFNVSPMAGQGNVRYMSPVPATEARMFFRPATAEAATTDRLPSATNPGATPYNPSPSVYLVERIEVATA